MAVEAENLTFDDLKQITEGLSMRQTSPMVTPEISSRGLVFLFFLVILFFFDIFLLLGS